MFIYECEYGRKNKKERRRLFLREECIIRDSKIDGVENGIYGSIVSGVMEGNNGRGYSFISSNNSFVECYGYRREIYDDMEMNEEYKNTNYTSRLSLSTSSSHTITNCTFTNCSSSGNGGAIYFDSSTYTYTVTITSCTFTDCSANFGGAVFCYKASCCVVSGCSFVNCTATSSSSTGGGGICMYSISTCAGVKDSNISSCTAATEAGGVKIYSSNVTGTDCEGGVEYGIVSGCRFSDCNATNYYGGGIYLNSISVSTVQSCSFYSCHTSACGGGIYWNSPTSEQMSLSEWILDCVFELNSANSKGHDVYINSNSYNRTESIFDEMCYTLTNQVNRVVWDYSSTVYTHDDWLPYRDPSVFDGYIYINGSKNSSSSSCGVWSDVCGSLSGGIESSYYTSSAFSGIVLMEGIHSNDERGINIGDNTLPIRSHVGEVEFDVTSSFSDTSSVFMISSGRLNMSGFTIVLKKTVWNGYNLIYVSSTGSVILHSMTISGGSSKYGTNNTPLLDIGSGSISCDTVTFENISRLSGNGTIFEFPSLSASINLCNMTFNNCRCESGSGGVIFVSLTSSRYKVTLSSLTFTSCSASKYGGGVCIDGGSYISTNTLLFGSLTFSSCSASMKGGNVYIIASALTHFTGYSSWSGVVPKSYSSSDEGKYMGVYSSSTIDILHLVYAPSAGSKTDVYASSSSSGIENTLCGWSDIPCQRIGTAYGHLYTSGSSFSVKLI